MLRSIVLVAFPIAGLVLMSNTGCHQPSAADTQASVSRTANSPSASDNARAGGALRVTAGNPTIKPLRLDTLQPGRIEPFEQTPLYAKIAGYVEEISVDIGDRVEKDQVLVRLRVPELWDELRQKEALLALCAAEVQQAEAAIEAARAARHTAQTRVAHAEAAVTRTDAEAERWRAQHDRIRDLAGRGSVTQTLVDETLNQYRASESARQESAAQIESARAGVAEAEANLAKARADAAAAEARRQVAEADLARARTMVGYCEITAPFDGVVTRRHADTGHYVQATSDGSKPLLVVARSDRVRIFVDVPEAEAALVNVGDKAVVSIQALRGREVTGTVTRTAWALDAANRSLRTEIELPAEHGDVVLRPGLYAMARITLADRDDVLTLPTTAIVRQGRETFCCRVEDGTVLRTPVTLGLRSGGDVEVLSGLDGSETVVLLRADSLEEGQTVEVIQTEPAGG